MAFDVRTICLAILSSGEATGYEIKKQVEEGPAGHFLEASFSAIYPALARLEGEGLVSCRTEAQGGKPDRKVYALTDGGRAAFDAALRDELAPDRFRSEFLFAMLFADRMPAAHVKRLIEARIANYRAEIAELKAAQSDSAGSAFVRGYGLAIFGAAIDYLTTHRHLLEARSEGARPEPEARRHAYQS